MNNKANKIIITFLIIIIIAINFVIIDKKNNKIISKTNDKYTKVSFTNKDRALGENTTSGPMRACASLIAKVTSISQKEILEAQIKQREETTIGDKSAFTRGSAAPQVEKICKEQRLKPYIAYGDLDGDYLSEILTIDYNGNIYLYFNDGENFKKTKLIRPLPKNKDEKKLPNYEGIAIFADANNDKLNDIILTPDNNRNYITIIKNKSNREFDLLSPIFIPTENHFGSPESVITDDINKDGLVDIVMTIRTDWTRSINLRAGQSQMLPLRLVRVFLSRPQPTYYKEVTTSKIPIAIADESVTGAISDFNTPVKTEPVAGNKVRPYQPFMPLLHDFNLDGKLDIFIAADIGGSRIFFQENDKFVDYTTNSSVASSGSGMGAELYDFNHDGLLDILTTEVTYKGSNCAFDRACDYRNVGNVIFLSNGDKTFKVSGTFASDYNSKAKKNEKMYGDYNPGIRHTGFAWGFSSLDYNMDGYHDYFIGVGMSHPTRGTDTWDANFDKPYLLLGKSNKTWFDATKDIFRSLNILGTSQVIASTDFNGDYRPDIIILSDNMINPELLLNTTKTKNSSAALVIRGSGLGGSPYNGEGSIITVKIKNKPTQKFKLPSKSSNFRSYSATSPIMIGLEKENEAIVTVEFTSGKIVTEKIRKNKINIISENN